MTSDDQRFCACEEPELVQQVRGGSLVVSCERCGIEAVTTHYPPEWRDKATYTIRVLSSDNEMRSLIKFLTTQERISIAQAKDLVEQRDLIFERTGSSSEILELAKKLAEHRIGYRCSPRFPHFIQYQIVALEQQPPDQGKSL